MYLKTLILAATSLGLAPSLLDAQERTQTAVTVEVVIALDVQDRQPVGGAEAFPDDIGQLVAWTRVTGAANTTIEHVWKHRDHELVVPLEIGGSPWRTWSRKNIPPEWDGEWTFEVRDADGEVVSITTFTVGGGRWTTPPGESSSRFRPVGGASAGG